MLLPGLCRQISQDLPDVKLATTIGVGDELIPQLESGQLNIVVLTTRQMADTLSVSGLGHDHIVVVGAESHPVHTGEVVEPRDLRSEEGRGGKEWVSKCGSWWSPYD